MYWERYPIYTPVRNIILFKYLWETLYFVYNIAQASEN